MDNERIQLIQIAKKTITDMNIGTKAHAFQVIYNEIQAISKNKQVLYGIRYSEKQDREIKRQKLYSITANTNAKVKKQKVEHQMKTSIHHVRMRNSKNSKIPYFEKP